MCHDVDRIQAFVRCERRSHLPRRRAVAVEHDSPDLRAQIAKNRLEIRD
jgi:hypothetical protein